MTLGITIVSPHGTWQASDRRLFDVSNGRTVTTPSTKQFALISIDGVILVTYAGLGAISPTSHVSDLLADLLRGEMRTIDQTIQALANFSNRRLVPVLKKLPPPFNEHYYAIGGHLGGKPFYAEVMNLDIVRGGYPRPEFKVRTDFVVRRVPVDAGIAAITGVRDAVLPEDIDILRRVRERRPSRPEDYLELLAGMISRAARNRPDFISSESWAWYLPPNGGNPEKARHFPPGDSLDGRSEPRVLVHGFDLHTALREVAKQLKPEDAFGRFHELWEQELRQAARIEVGTPVYNEEGRRGHVAVDPVAAGDFNDIGIRWDDTPDVVSIENRGAIRVDDTSSS